MQDANWDIVRDIIRWSAENVFDNAESFRVKEYWLGSNGVTFEMEDGSQIRLEGSIVDKEEVE